MTFSKFCLVGAALTVIMALGACNKEPEHNEPGNDYNDAEYAASATISSSDSNFIPSDDGGTIYFSAGGGAIVINVSIGCGWMVDNNASDIFTTAANTSAGTLTVTAGQNTGEEDLTGTIVLLTENQRIEFATITVVQNAYEAPAISVEVNEWNAPAKGALSIDIAVDCSFDDYEVEIDDDDWLSCEKTGKGITLTADENKYIKSRSANVTLTATDGTRTGRQIIAVTQDPKAYISLSSDGVVLAASGDSAEITVDCYFDVNYSYKESWLTVEADGATYKFSATANDGTAREADVTFTFGDGAENNAEYVLTVTQYGKSALMLSYSVNAGDMVTLPLAGTVNASVDWGDGVVERITYLYPTHTFYDAGEYNVAIEGTLTGLNSFVFSDSSTPDTKLTSVLQWGSTGLTSLDYAFYFCQSLVSVPADDSNSFSAVTSFNNAFSYCTSLKTIPKGLFANCSKATNMSACFAASGLSEVPSGLLDNCTSVENLSSFFKDCSSLTAIPSGLFSNCKEATNFQYTLYGSGLKTIPDGTFKGLDKAENFFGVAANCSSLTTVGSEIFSGCSSVTTFQRVFQYCSSLATIGNNVFAGCSSVETLSEAFAECGLTEVPKGLFSDCVKVTYVGYVFFRNTKLKTLPERLFSNCAEILNFTSLCCQCSSLETVPSDLFSYSPLCTNFSFVFADCSSLKELPDGLFENNKAAENFEFLCYDCTSLKTIPDGLFDSCTEATNFECLFYFCTSLSAIPNGLFDNCKEADDMESTFYACTSIKEIPKGLFDYCTKLTGISAVFYDCTGLTEIPDGLFDNCPDIEDFSFAFDYCTKITYVPTNLLDNCKKITNFQASFYMMSNWAGESPYTEIDGVKVHLYDRTEALGFVVPTTTKLCFDSCVKLTDYNDIPSEWGGGGTGMSSVSKAATYSCDFEGVAPKTIIKI